MVHWCCVCVSVAWVPLCAAMETLSYASYTRSRGLCTGSKIEASTCRLVSVDSSELCYVSGAGCVVGMVLERLLEAVLHPNN